MPTSPTAPPRTLTPAKPSINGRGRSGQAVRARARDDASHDTRPSAVATNAQSPIRHRCRRRLLTPAPSVVAPCADIAATATHGHLCFPLRKKTRLFSCSSSNRRVRLQQQQFVLPNLQDEIRCFLLSRASCSCWVAAASCFAPAKLVKARFGKKALGVYRTGL